MKRYLVVAVLVGLLVCAVGCGGITEDDKKENIAFEKEQAESMVTLAVEDDSQEVLLEVTTSMERLLGLLGESSDLIVEQLELGYSPEEIARAARPTFQEFVTQVDILIARVNALAPSDAVWVEQVVYAKQYLGAARQAGLENVEGLRLMQLGDYDNATACILRGAEHLDRVTMITNEAIDAFKVGK